MVTEIINNYKSNIQRIKCTVFEIPLETKL